MVTRRSAGGRAALLAASLLALLAAAAGRARADAEGAMLKPLAGVVEVSRGGPDQWEELAEVDQVSAPDHVRTGADGRAAVALIDGSTIELGPDSHLSIERLEYESAAKRNIAVFRLKRGVARVAAGERYAVARSRFEIETPSAVISSQAAEYVVLYDEAEQFTDALVLQQQIEVVAAIGVIGPRTTVGVDEVVRVERGKFPSATRRLDADGVKRYLAMLHGGTAAEVVAPAGAPGDRLVSVHPALGGKVLRPEDLPEAVSAQVSEREAGRVAAPAPQWPLGERLSLEVRVHEQPIPEFLAAPPGEVPSAGVDVEF